MCATTNSQIGVYKRHLYGISRLTLKSIKTLKSFKKIMRQQYICEWLKTYKLSRTLSKLQDCDLKLVLISKFKNTNKQIICSNSLLNRLNYLTPIYLNILNVVTANAFQKEKLSLYTQSSKEYI
jgi:hypothetical protein